jgi:hypothetical protein
MGFTGSLILDRTPMALTDLDTLAGQDIELVGRRDDRWQFAAVDRHIQDTPGWPPRYQRHHRPCADRGRRRQRHRAAAGRQPRRSPVDHRAQRPDSAGRTAVADTRAMTAIAEQAVLWAAEV